jgi:hypothetical protein
VIVRFIDIGGIEDHHCLNFLFIINKTLNYNNNTYKYLRNIYLDYKLLLPAHYIPISVTRFNEEQQSSVLTAMFISLSLL